MGDPIFIWMYLLLCLLIPFLYWCYNRVLEVIWRERDSPTKRLFLHCKSSTSILQRSQGVNRCVLNMDEVANVSHRRRKVRCPTSTCQELLVEPVGGHPVYQCPFCSVYLRAKGVPPDFQGDTWQRPINEGNRGVENGQQTNELEGTSIDGTDLIGSHNQLNDHEDNQGTEKGQRTNEAEAVSIDGFELSQNQLNDHDMNENVSTHVNIRQQEQLLRGNGSVGANNKREQEVQLEDDCKNTSNLAYENDMLAGSASKINITNGEVGMAADCREREGAAVRDSCASPETHVLLDETTPQLPSNDTENCGMPSASEEKKEFVGECESDTAGEGAEQIIQSDMIGDNECELSFKYISSVIKSNNGLFPRKRTSRVSKLSLGGSGVSCEMPSKLLNAQLTERRPFSSDENSDDNESYSSASESASYESSDSEFDFPSPSAQSLQPPNLSDLHFQQKMPFPDVQSDSFPNPHQLEWKDVDKENAEIALESSNSALTTRRLACQDVDHHKIEEIPENSIAAVTSSVEVDVKTAYNVLNAVDQGGQGRTAEAEGHLQKDSVEDETALAGLEETTVVVKEVSHVRGENAELVGVLANIAGSVKLKECINSDTEEGYQVNKPKTTVTMDLQGLSGSPHLLSSVTEYTSQLKCGATLKEGISNARTLMLGTDASLCSLADGRELENCLGTQKNIKVGHSVANVKREDALATIARKTAGHTVKVSQSNIIPQKMCTEKVQEGSWEPLHPQRNMPLSDTNSQRWVASTSGDMPTKGDANNSYAAHNLELESVGVQPVPFVTEQGDSFSHRAVGNSESQLYYERDYSSEAKQRVNKAAAVIMGDSRPHHRRIYSEETWGQSQHSKNHTSQVQKKMHNEGLHGSRTRRMHQRQVEAAHEQVDGQGSWYQKQNHQQDMHMMQQRMNYSGSLYVSPLGNLQPFGSNCYANGSNAFVRESPSARLALTYRAPPHSWMFPVGYSAAPGCMSCIHCQHCNVPQLPTPPCGLFFNQPLPLAHQLGHMEWCNQHQAHQIQGSDQRASLMNSSPPGLLPQIVHTHDAAIARRKPRVSSSRKPKHYPPLPVGRAAPYVICKRCEEVLEVPTDVPYSDATVQKVQCGVCKKVAKFSVSKGSWTTGNAALDSTTKNKVSVSTSHASQYNEKSRQPSVSNVVQNIDYSYVQGIDSGLLPPVKQGSFGSQQHISAASKRRGSVSLEEVVQSPKCERDASDQGEFFFRSLSRYSEFDSSRIFFNGFKASSSAIEADMLLERNVMHSQVPGDEKDEGLDFGAPRMSDGDSLDQRSPKSRMRSPENKQHFRLQDLSKHAKRFPENRMTLPGNEQDIHPLDLSRHGKGSLKYVEHMENEAVALKKKMIAEGKKPTVSLFELLNQESSKFKINMDERVSFDEAPPAWFSTASSSPMDDEYTGERCVAGGYDMSQASTVASKHCGRKGPKYVVGMLKRSLKDFSRAKQ